MLHHLQSKNLVLSLNQLMLKLTSKIISALCLWEIQKRKSLDTTLTIPEWLTIVCHAAIRQAIQSFKHIKKRKKKLQENCLSNCKSQLKPSGCLKNINFLSTNDLLTLKVLTAQILSLVEPNLCSEPGEQSLHKLATPQSSYFCFLSNISLFHFISISSFLYFG